LGPEHEFSIVDNNLKVLPISDQIIKDFNGRIVNFIKLPNFSFGKELQLHVLELKANSPFRSPCVFEETMQNGVATLQSHLQNYHANLLGTGMHPLLALDETRVWPHRHSGIYQEFDRIFNLKQHGWLNIQSFHLNLSYAREATGVLLHNLIMILIAYLPAISASSPIFEGKMGQHLDMRLYFYKINQRQVPSVTGDIIPEPVSSFEEYREKTINCYSEDLVKAGAGRILFAKEWVNSRGVIFRFERSAIEVRVLDEQECVKSDVALSCFIRAALRGLIADRAAPLPHEILVKDFNEIIDKGLDARVSHPEGKTARQVCEYLLNLAWANAEEDEKKYLWIIRKRIENGSLSSLIRERVLAKAQRTEISEAIVNVYSTLIKCLVDNQPYF
jgi:carboxylate-amine ligase